VDSAENLKTMGIANWIKEVTGSGPMESNRKRGQGSSCTAALQEKVINSSEIQVILIRCIVRYIKIRKKNFTK
jgi:hypothetical protein